jgi:hypothetical protein
MTPGLYTATVAKGGIAAQLLGWNCTLPLYTGGILCDTGYLMEVKVFDEQEAFAKNNPMSKVSFLNIFDEGYR